MNYSMVSSRKILKILSLILIIVLVFSINAHADENKEGGEGFDELKELTGNLNYILFGLAVIILPWKYFYKFIMKNVDKDSTLRNVFSSLNSFVKKSHMIIGAGAFGVISYHAYITMDKWNILLPLGLALVGIYVITGILFYIKSLNSKLRSIMYKVHRSIIFLIITVAILYAGHLLAN